MGSGAFAGLLRDWRQARGLSQQRLGEAAEVSTRHISFLETGKSAPSRTMVLVLANALELPLRERNRLLQAAGFAAAYRETRLANAPEGPLRRTLELILRHHGPIPAVAVTPTWDVVAMNPAALRMFSHFIAPGTDPIVASNLVHAVFHPDGPRRFTVNWDQVASSVLDRIRHEASLELERGPFEDLLESIAGYPDMPVRPTSLPEQAIEVFLPVHLKRDSLELRLFTTIATLGTPVDVGAQELRIECYYPADPQTEDWLERQHAGG